MRVLLSTYGSRGDVEPVVALAVQLRALGAEVRVCAPPDEEFAELLAGVGVPLMPIGQPWRSIVRPSAAGMPRRTAELIATQFDTITAEAEGCDLLAASGVTHFAARSAAEKLGIRYVYATFCPVMLPSPYRPPLPQPDRPFPPEGADNRVLWDLDAQSYNEMFGAPLNTHRASIGLPLVDNVRDFIFTDHPWLAADPTLGPWQETTDLDVLQTGAWILPDERPLPAELVAFLDAGEPPVYVGFGSMRRVPEDIAQVAIEAIRAQGRRALVGHGWADLALVDDRADCFVVGEVNQQALFGRVAAVVHHGGAGTTTTAARTGAPQVVVPQAADQPYWAARVADLGIGAAHDGPTPTTESLSAALRTALTPETRARATAVAGTIRTDGATVAATLLLDALSRERPPASAMTTTIALTDTERAYLQSQPLGRLATVDASGAPQNNPIGVFLDEETGDIVVGGHAMGASRKFRNVQANAQVALVIDDLVSTDPWTVRGLEIRGTAVALSDVDPPVSFMSREVIRITPTWVCAWGLDPDVGRTGRQRRPRIGSPSD